MSIQSAINDSHWSFRLMGILNITPDSFYDGGNYKDVDQAIIYAHKMIADGADILDVGGASSRPGAAVVGIREEIERIKPVITRIRKVSSITISVDTTWSEVAHAALDMGADWINDTSAGRFDPLIATVVAQAGATVVLMHSRGTPPTMQNNPQYDDVVYEVKNELLNSVRFFIEKGVKRERVVIDPGIGFGKTLEHNCMLMKHIGSLCQLGFPVLVGTSRKSFIGTITNRTVGDRLAGSLGSIALAYLKGATIFRVHDVASTRDFLKVLEVINNSK